MDETIKCIFSITTGVIVNLLGGWDAWLTSLLTLMVTDIVVGIIKAILNKSEKSKNGGLNSTSMFRGGLQKFLILVLISLGTFLDAVIGPNQLYVRSTVTAYYIANEALSILENIALCGVPLPKVLYSALDILKENKEK